MSIAEDDMHRDVDLVTEADPPHLDTNVVLPSREKRDKCDLHLWLCLNQA